MNEGSILVHRGCTDLAVASALVEFAESLALDGRHAIPVLVPVAQIDPRFTLADGARQHVAAARLELDPARRVVLGRQDPAVRKRRLAFLRHLLYNHPT